MRLCANTASIFDKSVLRRYNFSYWDLKRFKSSYLTLTLCFEIFLSKTDKPLSALLADLPKLYSTPELRVDCPDESKFKVVERIAQYFAKDHEVNTIDGARIQFEHGWGLVRPSNTQAIIVMRFEADTNETLREIREAVELKVDELINSVYR